MTDKRVEIVAFGDISEFKVQFVGMGHEEFRWNGCSIVFLLSRHLDVEQAAIEAGGKKCFKKEFFLFFFLFLTF